MKLKKIHPLMLSDRTYISIYLERSQMLSLGSGDDVGKTYCVS